MSYIIYWQKYAVYFDSIGTEYIPQDALNKIKDKSITQKNLQLDDSITCGFYCIAFTVYMFVGENYQKNDKIIYKYTLRWYDIYSEDKMPKDNATLDFSLGSR